MFYLLSFQSTRSQRPRRAAEYPIISASDISIHEVAKTSTAAAMAFLFSVKFQSTRSQRPRRPKNPTQNTQMYFNPRGRKDLDCAVYSSMTVSFYFNPRGRKDLDNLHLLYSGYRAYFNPRGRKDLDNSLDTKRYSALIFQSTRSQRPRL